MTLPFSKRDRDGARALDDYEDDEPKEFFLKEEYEDNDEEDEPDELGPYPADVNDSPSHERTQERALRAMTIGLIVSGCINIAMISLLIAVFPLQSVTPYLVTFKDSAEQVVAIEPISTSAPGILYATEDNVRDYVMQRHSFTPINTVMDAQWGPASRLAARTAPTLFGKFTQQIEDERAQLMTEGYYRDIEIDAVNRIGDTLWQVDFSTIDSLGGQTTAATGSSINGVAGSSRTSLRDLQSRRSWRATLDVNYFPQRVTYDKRLVNPLGFTVTDYSVTRRN